MDNKKLKERVIFLRKQGKTYSEINKEVDILVPKSTLSYWCNNINLTANQQKKINSMAIKNILRGQKLAVTVNKLKREKYLKSVEARVRHLKKILNNKNVAKIALTMLFLGEGSKSVKGSLSLGNSNPDIIRLFLSLLRFCHKINERKFRCTLQCRADQNIEELEKFWSKITNIPLAQFYKARIDVRTIGKPSKKKDYKGVCRIDYFSADIFNELIKISELLSE